MVMGARFSGMSSRRRDRWCHRGGRDGGGKSKYGVEVAKVDVVKEDTIIVDGLETLDSLERWSSRSPSILFRTGRSGPRYSK